MENTFLNFILIFIAFLCFRTINGINLVDEGAKVKCKDSERDALLSFKEGFKAQLGLIASWNSKEDCCEWRGVRCNNITSHVTALDLHSPHPSLVLQGELRKSLLDLPYLSYLDLSLNDFQQIQIPEFVGSLSDLRYLNLSHANFRGIIPDHLGNLSSLQYLDLSGNRFSLKVDSLDWLHGLSSMKFLDLSGVDLSNAVNWLDSINRLSSLRELQLFACKLHKLAESLPHVNFTSLEILNLSFNYLDAQIPNWLFRIRHTLVYLDLRRNQLHGLIPDDFGIMTSLITLDLSDNNLTGHIPNTIVLREHSSLQVLNLSSNRLNGSVVEIIPNLSKLFLLDLSWNSLEGIVTDTHLANFTNLRALDFSSNKLLLMNASLSWVPPFQLEKIGLQSCPLGHKFPQWLQTQKHLAFIDISNCSISDTVPDWFWNLSSTIEHMNLSFNVLKGNVPDLLSKSKLLMVDLSYNEFSCPLPLLPPNVNTVVLARNSFTGPASRLCEMLRANNSLSYLDLSFNNLSGQFPNCWIHGTNLVILNLGSNNLSGHIPFSIGNLLHLNTLRLDNNSLSGKVPLSLKNCTSLFVLDLGLNRLSGSIPAWIGENLSNLMILRLRSNALEGEIPAQLCRLQSLKILDLAFNNLSGAIPRCVNNLAAIVNVDSDRSYIYYPYTTYAESVELTVKGLQLSYKGTLKFVKTLDFSSNMLSGEIPPEITSLIGLYFLNLSRNNLNGNIPPSIGEMSSLESLDLSLNQLSCSIPAGMMELTFLVQLNLSYNKLSGPIPVGAQLLTFDATTYLGNHNLCGVTLTKSCSENHLYEDPNCLEPENKNGSRKEGTGHGLKIPAFYISLWIGFVVGFWGFWAPLLIKTSWRHAYFRFLGTMIDNIYVRVVVAVARMQRKFQSPQVVT